MTERRGRDLPTTESAAETIRNFFMNSCVSWAREQAADLCAGESPSTGTDLVRLCWICCSVTGCGATVLPARTPEIASYRSVRMCESELRVTRGAPLPPGRAHLAVQRCTGQRLRKSPAFEREPSAILLIASCPNALTEVSLFWSLLF